ncbi:di-trans,poly-cis-decaprenylcistransferase [Candidatus Saccharibacteria bacterium]|nr:di-trans,poly-cis-decaprenylcistransferase [Candidatus Saccharibacteria bacterium]
MKSENTIPKHIGFIVDGNRRWARERNLPTLEGHRRGFKKVEMVATEMIEKGVEFVSFYLFSTENWDRSEEEVSYLMDLLRHNAKRMTKKFKKENIRCVIMGRAEPAPQDILDALHKLEDETKDGTRGTVCICFNYGGQWEIADAFSKMLEDGFSGEVTPEIVAKYLYHPEVPPCDLIVRTSGEERISGFQLWRASYSEFLFLKKKFPGITAKDCDKILEEFSSRSRRFGK